LPSRGRTPRSATARAFSLEPSRRSVGIAAEKLAQTVEDIVEFARRGQHHIDLGAELGAQGLSELGFGHAHRAGRRGGPSSGFSMLLRSNAAVGAKRAPGGSIFIPTMGPPTSIHRESSGGRARRPR